MALAVAACESPVPTTPGVSGGTASDGGREAASPDLSSPPQGLRPTGGIAATPVFDLDLDVEGAMRPGATVLVVGDAEAVLPSDGAVLRLSLPELAEARRRGPEGFRVPVERQLPAQAERRGPVGRSAQVGGAGEPRMASLAADLRAGLEALASFPGNDASAAATAAAQPYRYRLVYWDGFAYRPVVGARVQVAHVPSEINSLQDTDQIVRRTKRSDSQGRFSVECLTSHEYFTVNVRARAAGFSIVPESFGDDAGDYEDCAAGVNLDRQLIAQSDQAHLFGNMRDIVPASRNLLDRSRGRVRMFLDISVDVSQYDPDNDVILMKASEPDHIFGSFGLFTAAHEYGHAVHHGALGGLNPDYSDNCSPHNVRIRSSLGCALSEGFADYHAVATAGSGASWFFPIRDGTFAVVDSTHADAVEAEGPVASVLFDITDAADDGSEIHDRIDYPGTYVSQVIESCFTAHGKADGMDIVLYCFEQEVRDEVVNHTNSEFFFTRGGEPSGVIETATEPSVWALADLRDVWLHNLYHVLGPLDGGGSGGSGDDGGGDGDFCVPEPPALRC